jgi:hypothetical protein
LRRRVVNPLIWREIAKALDAGCLLMRARAGATHDRRDDRHDERWERRRCRSRITSSAEAAKCRRSTIRALSLPAAVASEFGPSLQTLAPDDDEQEPRSRLPLHGETGGRLPPRA